MTRSVLTDYWEAQQRNDSRALGRLRHRDYTTTWPQSGERVRGHENYTKIHENYPDYPAMSMERMAGKPEEWAMSPLLSPVRLCGEGDFWVSEGTFHYPDGEYAGLGIIELKEGLVWNETEYWAKVQETPDWRKPLVVPIPAESDFRQVKGGSPAEEQQRRAALERFAAATEGDQGSMEARRASYRAAVQELFHEDAIQDFRQSGGRAAPLSHILATIDAQPDFPAPSKARRIDGRGDVFVLERKLTYTQSVWHAAFLYEFSGEKVKRMVAYFAEQIGAPGWRAAWVERLEA
jgi:hypothetical protein